MRREALAALLAMGLVLALAAAAAADDRVYLRFLDFPVAGRPVKWGARALVGNCNHGAGGRIEASVPVSGNTVFGMYVTGGDSWATSDGVLTFAQPGQVTVWFKVSVRTCTNQTLNLVQEQVVTVTAARE